MLFPLRAHCIEKYNSYLSEILCYNSIVQLLLSALWPVAVSLDNYLPRNLSTAEINAKLSGRWKQNPFE